MVNLNAPVRHPPVALGQIGGNQGQPGGSQFSQGLNPRFNPPGSPGLTSSDGDTASPGNMSSNQRDLQRRFSRQPAPRHPEALPSFASLASATALPPLRSVQRPSNPNIPQDPAIRQMLSQLDPEQREMLRQLPPEKLNELFSKWKRTGMLRPGQLQQGAPMNQANPNNAANPMSNPMHQQPQGGMGAQMQQANLQNQMNRFRGGNPLQHPQAQIIMDNMDLPPQVTQLIPGIPPDAKKWGQFKAWVSQTNAGIPEQQKQMLRNIQLGQFKRMVMSHGQAGVGVPQQPGAPNANPLGSNVESGSSSPPSVSDDHEKMAWRHHPNRPGSVSRSRQRWRPLNAQSLACIVNKHTISKDNTIGEEARETFLLINMARKIGRMAQQTEKLEVGNGERWKRDKKVRKKSPLPPPVPR